MALPQKEFYSISDLANKWSATVSDIEEYLLTGKIQASVHVPRKMMYKYTLQLLDDGTEGYDVELDDPDFFIPRQGLFNINYQDIEWDEHGQAKFEKGSAPLTLFEDNACYGFNETFVLSREKIVIAVDELNRFEDEYGLAAQTENTMEKTTFGANELTNDINPKTYDSLLKMVITMAINSYDYSPLGGKSSVPSEIVEDASNLGISITDDTVRKYLKLATVHISSELQTDIAAQTEEDKKRRRQLRKENRNNK